jgi:hypothetical protein
MDTAEHLDEADAIKRRFLNGEVELFNSMLICARYGKSSSDKPAASQTRSSQNSNPAVKRRGSRRAMLVHG